MLSRIAIYLYESFKIFSRILISVTLFFSLTLVYRMILGTKLLPDIYSSISGIATLFLILLYYRISDEFKDRDTDEKFFPHRPLPSGRVTVKDLRILLAVTTMLLFAVQLLYPHALFSFMLVFLYAFLMRHWFFMEQWIAENRLLAFVTHAPIAFFMNYHVLVIYRTRLGLDQFSIDMVLPILVFAVPGFYWEIARKSFAPSKERDGYQTYSSMLGKNGAGVLSIFFLLLELVLIFAMNIDFSTAFLVVVTAASVIAALSVVLYMVKPEKFGRFMTPICELYTTVFSALFLIEGLMRL